VKNLKSRTVAITLILITAAFMIGYALSSDAAKPRIIQLPFSRIARMLSRIEAKLDKINPQQGEATDLTEVNEKLATIEGKLDHGLEEVTDNLSGINSRLDQIEANTAYIAGMQSVLEEIQETLDIMQTTLNNMQDGEGEGPVLDY